MRLLMFCFFILIVMFQGFSQENTDSIFNSAVNFAIFGNYKEATDNAKKVFKIHPERDDVSVFIANVYAWQEDYDVALKYIDSAYSINQKSKELFDSWLNILLWSKRYDDLINVAEIAQQSNYTDTFNLFLKKTLAYKELEEYQKGIGLIEANIKYTDTIVIKNIYDEMLILSKKNAVTFYYSVDYFENNEPKPHHLLFLDYSFKKGKTTLISRLNYANRFENTDFQIESDCYHILANKHYTYINLGVGLNENLFPKYRGGLEYYFPFHKKNEASLGGRFLYAENKSVIIFTGHLSRYASNLWFSLRPFYVLHEEKNSLTLLLTSRYYFENTFNYWGFEVLYGYSPDERYLVMQPLETITLKNYRIKIERNLMLFKYNELKLSFAYAVEEFIVDNLRNRFTLEVFFKHKF